MNAALVGCAALAGCDRGTSNGQNGGSLEAQQQENTAQPAELPPMVVRSPSYRCDDGKALYVDVLTDDNVVIVRDSRADLPTRLSRQAGSDPFGGEEHSLSGTGDVVRYSAPGRPEQECRAAPA